MPSVAQEGIDGKRPGTAVARARQSNAFLATAEQLNSHLGHPQGVVVLRP